jgi:hypothetical protein
MEVVLSEASKKGLKEYAEFNEDSCGSSDDVRFLLTWADSTGVSAHILERLMRVLPMLACGSAKKMTVLTEHFRRLFNFNNFDAEHSQEDVSRVRTVACFILMTSSLVFQYSFPLSFLPENPIITLRNWKKIN